MADEALTFGTLQDLRAQISEAMASYPDPIIRAWMLEQGELNPGQCLIGRFLGDGVAEIVFVADGREIALLRYQSLLGPDGN